MRMSVGDLTKRVGGFREPDGGFQFPSCNVTTTLSYGEYLGQAKGDFLSDRVALTFGQRPELFRCACLFTL